MRKVELRMKELNKYEVIKELVDHNGNKLRAKEKLQKEKKLENKTEEEIQIIVNNEVALEDSHPRGEKPKYFGELTECV